jgi:hypothetical protein
VRRIRIGVAAVVLLGLGVVTPAGAQRADCPLKDAPMPTKPPGMPPTEPPIPVFPEKFGDPVVLPPRVAYPPSDTLLEADEGHITAVARAVGRAQQQGPRQELSERMVDVSRTLLSQWRFAGYVPDGFRVTRVFTREGSTLVFDEWHMALQGGSIVGAPQPTVPIGRSMGSYGGARSPSGCVNTVLAWEVGEVMYTLEIVGPKAHDEQRKVLLDVARSIEAVSR